MGDLGHGGSSFAVRPSKRDCHTFATTIATLLVLAASASAAAQSASGAFGGAPADQLPSTKITAVPQVTVEARALEKRVHTFISNVTAVPYWSIDDPVQLWRRPICPLVAGLPRKEGEFIFDRLATVLTSIGAARGGPGCHPNFFIIVTAEPEAGLNEMWDRNWHVFGDASPTLVKRFIARPRPVRIWYNDILAGADQTPGTTSIVSTSNLASSPFDTLPTFEHDGNGLRARFAVLRDMLAVVAIVDSTKVAGLDWGQVTDYVAMTGLTKVDLDADVGNTPTILHLFTTSPESRPRGLSDWDKAFLKELYHSDVISRHQRKVVSQQMIQDLTR
jgi:hypothetical protein